MRYIMASAALCALLSPLPVAAQSDNAAPGGTEVYRNDLPETHDGVDLPELATDAASQLPDDLQQAFAMASAGALAAQQYGNLAASKYASGAVRDLGDRMVLLNSAISDRLGGEADEALSAPVRADLEVLDDLNGEDFDRLFTTWVTTVYPGLIEAWSRLGEHETFADLSQAVTPELEQQLATARDVLSGEGNSTHTGGAQETGAEGQTGERQHSHEPEQPEVQSGENYEHEQVEVDPSSRTGSLPDDSSQPETAPAAGDLGIVNTGIVFAVIEDPSTELAQLEQAGDFAADEVRVVSLGEHLSDSELGTLDSTVSEHQSNLSDVRDAVSAQQKLSDALEQAGASAEDVVAFDVLGDEGIVLYTRSTR